MTCTALLLTLLHHIAVTATDRRTGLLTLDAWQPAARRAVREHPTCALLLVDVDHFKQVNDTYGHLVGDRLIAEVATQIRNTAGADGVAGRFGGDEFVVLLLDSGVPAREIVVAGDSAGGGLALSVVTTLARQDLPLPGATVHLCPGVDLSFEEEIELPSEPQPAVSMTQLRSFAAAYLNGTSPHDEVVNALRADLTGYPPMLVQAGTGDVLGGDAHRLVEHARAHGVDVQFELYPATTHDFQVFWSFLPEAAAALDQAGAFIREVRGRASARDVG